MKKTIVTVLILISLFQMCTVSAFEAPEVSILNASGVTGEIVEIPVILSGNRGFSNLSIEINYDNSALKFVEVVSGTDVGAGFTKAQNLTNTPFNMSWDKASNTTFNGVLATLKFEIITEKSATYPISVDYYKGRNGNYIDGDNVNYDENFSPLGLVYSGGKIIVNGGDLNSITVSRDLEVTLTGEIGTGRIYAALYDKSNCLKQVKTYLPTQLFDISFDLSQSGDAVKIMWWNDKFVPMCEDEKAVCE